LLDALAYTLTGTARMLEIPDPAAALSALPAFALLAAAAMRRTRSEPWLPPRLRWVPSPSAAAPASHHSVGMLVHPARRPDPRRA